MYYQDKNIGNYIYVYSDKYETESYDYQNDDIMKYIEKYIKKNKITNEVIIWDRNNRKYIEK